MAVTSCGLPIDTNTLEMNTAVTPPVLRVKAGAITVPDATTTVKGVVKQSANQADSVATTAEGLVTDFNALLDKLKTAGIMVADV